MELGPSYSEVNLSPTQRNRVRHPQLRHLVEDVASREDLVALCFCVPRAQPTTEALLGSVERILRPGLLVLPFL